MGMLVTFSRLEFTPTLQKSNVKLFCHYFIYSLAPESLRNLGPTLKNFLLQFFIPFLHTLLLLKMVFFCQFLNFLFNASVNHWAYIINIHFDENNGFERN